MIERSGQHNCCHIPYKSDFLSDFKLFIHSALMMFRCGHSAQEFMHLTELTRRRIIFFRKKYLEESECERGRLVSNGQFSHIEAIQGHK